MVWAAFPVEKILCYSGTIRRAVFFSFYFARLQKVMGWNRRARFVHDYMGRK